VEHRRRIAAIAGRVAAKSYYHGASRESADYLLAHGFGTVKRFEGMESGVSEEYRRFTYLAKTKDAAEFYAGGNFRFKEGVVLRVRLNGRVLNLKYRGEKYGAMMAAGRELGLDVDADNPRGMVPTKQIVNKLKQEGYSAIEFHDSSSGYRAVLVIEPGKIEVQGEVKKRTARVHSIARKIVATTLPTGTELGVPSPTEAFDRDLANLQAAREAGEVWNADFKEWKRRMDTGFDKAIHEVTWKAIQRFKQENDRDMIRMQKYNEAYEYGSMSFVKDSASLLKKLAKTAKKRQPDTIVEEHLTLLENALKQWLPIHELLQDLKPMIKKGRRNVGEGKPVYQPPPARAVDLTKVRTVLEEVVNDARARYVTRIREWLYSGVERYFDKLKEETEDTEGRAIMLKHSPRRLMRDGAEFLYGDMIEFDRSLETFVLKGNHPQLAQEIAEREADAIREQFLTKNMAKMTSLIGEKGVAVDKAVVTSGEFNAWSFEGEIRVTFDDDTAFTVRNKIVTSVSNRGNRFNRFPTTFHDVKFPDGSVQRMRSEKQMNEEWVKAGKELQ